MYFKPSWISKSALFVLQLCGKKEKHFVTKKRPKKSHFPKRGNPCFWSKKCQFFLYLISVKTRLVVVLLNDFLEKKETFLSIRKNNFSKSKKSPFFFKGVNPLLLAKKCHFSTFFDLKKQHFSKAKKSLFFKGVNPYFLTKNANFILNLNLIKISLEIMLSDFAEKKRNLSDLKRQNFSKSKKRTFSKRLTHAFGQKMPFFKSIQIWSK